MDQHSLDALSLCNRIDWEVYMNEELPFDHEPSLDHWAKCIANDDIATGYHTNWHHAYEDAWHSLDAEYNYSYEYQWG